MFLKSPFQSRRFRGGILEGLLPLFHVYDQSFSDIILVVEGSAALSSLDIFTSFCNCSMKMNVKIVLGLLGISTHIVKDMA